MPEKHQKTPSKSLEGIRVLDLSRVLAGPSCTQILGDLGADIIKIERPSDKDDHGEVLHLGGDDTRSWGPPFLKDHDGNDTTESAYYLSCNRNKRSLAVDLRSTEGQEIIHKLIAQSDILVENFKVGSLDKFGLGYEQIKEQHPSLIYCAISGFGQNGPLAKEPGYDFLAQGMSGLMAATGAPDSDPMKVGVALSDIMTGLNATIGILAALHHRDQTGGKDGGEGQLVDVALTDCTLAAMTNLAQYYLTSGQVAPRLGNAHSTIVPYQAFKAKDGQFIILAIGNDSQFGRFSKFIGHEDWSIDPRFATNRARVENRKMLVTMIETTILKYTSDYWISHMEELNVPCGPVNTMDQVFATRQIQDRDMEIHMQHPLSDAPISLVGSPLKLSATPVSYERTPPICGQDTDSVLKEVLDFDDDAVAQLRARNIIE